MAGRPKTLRSNFTFTEGPIWIESQQALLFSDVRENIVWRYQAPNKFDRYFTNTSGTNGLAVFNGQQLYMCQVEGRRLMTATLPTSADDPAPQVSLVTDKFDGKRYNQTNDVTTRSDGNIYFTDPAFRPHPLELDYLGVYRISPSNEISVISKTLQPNGIIVSPDEKWLYVTNAERVERFELNEAGEALNPKTYAIAEAGIDGMTIDVAGNLYVAVRNGIEVMDTNGQSYGVLLTPNRRATNCTFGGPDKKTLFVTTGTGGTLVSFEMPIPGAH